MPEIFGNNTFINFQRFLLGMKALIFIFIFVWIRATLPRLRFDSLMRFCWTSILPICIGILCLVPRIIVTFDCIPSPLSLIICSNIILQFFESNYVNIKNNPIFGLLILFVAPKKSIWNNYAQFTLLFKKFYKLFLKKNIRKKSTQHWYGSIYLKKL